MKQELVTADPAADPDDADEARELRALNRKVRRPIIAGVALIAVFVVGGFAWASTAQIAGAVMAPGVIRVESNRKTIKSRDGGLVREILVKEGSTVRKDQLLVRMDDTNARAQVEIMANTLDNLVMQRARFYAERDNAAEVAVPDALKARASEPVIANMIRDQEHLFRTRLAALEGQVDVLRKRYDQSKTRIEGLQAVVTSLEKQQALIDDELGGVQSLYDKALVQKTRLRALERSAAELLGNRGNQIAEIARIKEGMTEIESQIRTLQQQRDTEIADGLRDTQAKINDTLPRLRAAQEALQLTEVRSPDDGYVLGLTQFTINGVVGPGERLLDIVPTDTPLVIESRLKPDEAYEVSPGMAAHIQLATYEARQLPAIPATVSKISADRNQDQRTGEPFFTAELQIEPEALKKLVQQVRIYPGMSATAMIGTGERSILDYVTSPVRDSLRGALRER